MEDRDDWYLTIGSDRWAERFWQFVNLTALRGLAFPEPDKRRDPQLTLIDISTSLRKLRIGYADDPITRKSRNSQLIRDPDLVRSGEQATCIEMVGIASAACLGAGLHCWAVFGTGVRSGHAWMVVDLRTPLRYLPVPAVDGDIGDFGDWERRRLVDASDLVEDLDELRAMVERSPSQYQVFDPARCLLDYTELRQNPIRTDGVRLFDDFDRPPRGCSHVSWWWDAAWIKRVPRVEGKSRRDRRGLESRAMPTGANDRHWMVPTAALSLADGSEVFAMQTAAGIELRDVAEDVDGLPVVASLDGIAFAAGGEGAIEIGWLDPFLPDRNRQMRSWTTRRPEGPEVTAQVLAVGSRGVFGALVAVSDTSATWLVEVDPSGPGRTSKVGENTASAAAIVRGQVWMLVDGQLEGAGTRDFAMGTRVLDFDVAGSLGSEVLALLLEGANGPEIRLVRDPLGEGTMVHIEPGPSEETTGISIVRPLDPGTEPTAIRCFPDAQLLIARPGNDRDDRDDADIGAGVGS